MSRVASRISQVTQRNIHGNLIILTYAIENLLSYLVSEFHVDLYRLCVCRWFFCRTFRSLYRLIMVLVLISVILDCWLLAHSISKKLVGTDLIGWHRVNLRKVLTQVGLILTYILYQLVY